VTSIDWGLFLEKLWLVIFNYKKHNKNYIQLKIKDYPIQIIDGDRGANYPTKEEFLEGIKTKLLDFVEQIPEEVFEVAAANIEKFEKVQDPKQRFEMTISFILGEDWMQMADHHSVFYACYYLSSRYERIRERFQQMYQQYREMLETEAKVWYEKGLITYSDPTQVAEYLIMLNEGLTYYEGVLRNREAFVKRSSWLREMAVKTLTT
jgi:hypothetical protein